MRSGEDDAAGCFFAGYSQLGSRRRCHTDIDYIVAHTDECTGNEQVNHLTRDAGVTPHYDAVVVRDHASALGCISCGETNDVHRIEAVAYATTNGASDT